MMEEKRKFTGVVISGCPVTTQKAREAGIIKTSKVNEKPEEKPTEQPKPNKDDRTT